MKTRISFLTIIISAVVLWSGCTDLKDGLPLPVAPGVQVHLPSWIDTASTNFHGTFANSDVASCLKCHGQNYNGGNSKVSCITCHKATGGSIHGRGWVDRTSLKFHGKKIAAANWDMRPCQSCHGATYAGGKVPTSCTTCHNQAGGPENCATCHGTTNPAPPRDLSGNTAKTFRGVGAHQIHFLGSTLASAMFCNECHVVPGPIYAAGHIDGTPNAEVVMNNPLARTVTNERGTADWDSTLALFTPNPTYNASQFTCASTYCHGNFKNGNPTFAPVWTDASGAQMACGTCHGDVTKPTTLEKALPKTASEGGTHPQSTSCSACHSGVVDATGKILDPTKHINGKLNVFGQERDY